jgi:RHS repeat-associated protein
MFVWEDDGKQEARNSGGAITAQYFGLGEKISGTSYFYTTDQLGSIREMTDSSGTIHAEYAYDPYGRLSKLSETVRSDFQYGGYYAHGPSGLYLTRNRSYLPSLARWLSRDSLAKNSGMNVYAYVNNSPIINTDPSGLDLIVLYDPKALNGIGHCALLIGNEKCRHWEIKENYPGAEDDPPVTYKSLKQFYYYERGHFTRENSAWFSRSKDDDQKAIEAADEAISQGYDLATNNCVHTCMAGAAAAGLQIAPARRPKSYFRNAVAAGGTTPPDDQ